MPQFPAAALRGTRHRRKRHAVDMLDIIAVIDDYLRDVFMPA